MGNPQKHFEYEGVVVHRSKGRVEPSKSPGGYLYVTLRKKGRNQKFFVHRLVLEYYTVTYDPEYLYDHKDGNKNNNHVDNLGVYHAQFAYWRKQAKVREKAAAKEKPKPDFTPRTIKCEETGEIFTSITQCAKAFGVSTQVLSQGLRDPKQSVNGYTLTVVDPI